MRRSYRPAEAISFRADANGCCDAGELESLKRGCGNAGPAAVRPRAADVPRSAGWAVALPTWAARRPASKTEMMRGPRVHPRIILKTYLVFTSVVHNRRTSSPRIAIGCGQGL